MQDRRVLFVKIPFKNILLSVNGTRRNVTFQIAELPDVSAEGCVANAVPKLIVPELPLLGMFRLERYVLQSKPTPRHHRFFLF